MEEAIRGEVTLILDEAKAGVEDARERLARAVYRQLRRQAEDLIKKERADLSIGATGLINEAAVHVFDKDVLENTNNSQHLLRSAATAMRHILVDHARRRKAQKRGGELKRVPLDDILKSYEKKQVDIIALHEALDRLAERQPRQASVVEMKFFVGLTNPEIAAILNVSHGTVENDWRIARAYLRDVLNDL